MPGLPERIVLSTVTGSEGDRTTVDLVRPDGSDQQTIGSFGPAVAWSPDQSRVANDPGPLETSSMYTLDATGAVVAEVSLGARALAWSPAGDQLVFAPRVDLYANGSYLAVGPPDGAAIHRISDKGETKFVARSAAWSPNGNEIAYAVVVSTDLLGDMRNELRIVRPDGTGSRTLVSSKATDSSALSVGSIGGWSPDTGQLYFSAWDAADNLDIYSVPVAGGAPHKVIDDPQADDHPIVSPDGTSIAFCSNRTGTFQTYVAAIDGSGASAITSGTSDVCPTGWLPETRPHAAIESAAVGLTGTAIVAPRDDLATLSAISLDGASSSPFARDLVAGETVAAIALSPAGSSMLFEDETHRLFVGDPSGAEKRLLSAADEQVVSFAWSPDGTQVAYVETSGTNAHSVAVLGADGTGKRVIAATTDWYVERIGWSADGARLLVVNSPYDGLSEPGTYEIRLSDGRANLVSAHGGSLGPNGAVLFIGPGESSPCVATILFASDLSSAARNIGCASVTGGQGSSGWVVKWSPDGKHAAVVLGGGLWFVDTEPALLRHVATPPRTSPNTAFWTRDGQALVYDSWVIRADGTGQAPLALPGVEVGGDGDSVILDVR